MELDINKCTYDGQWFDFGNGRLKIKPYPASKQDISFSGNTITFSGKQTFDRFCYCLVEWDKFSTPAPENKPIALTDEVKKKVFDFNLGAEKVDDVVMTIPEFVTMKAKELFDSIREKEQKKAVAVKN